MSISAAAIRADIVLGWFGLTGCSLVYSRIVENNSRRARVSRARVSARVSSAQCLVRELAVQELGARVSRATVRCESES